MNEPSNKSDSIVIWVIRLLLVVLTGVLFWFASSHSYSQVNQPIVVILCFLWLTAAVLLCMVFFGLSIRGKSCPTAVWDIGSLLVVLTGVVFWLAQSFPYGQPPDRPIVTVVFVSWLASAFALCALFFGLRIKSNLKSMTVVIVLVAIATRLMLVFSNPILEVDYYRYLWDGIAANHGVAPYKYSPDAVLRSNADDPELKILQTAVRQSDSARTIVSRVHFEKYTTLYPPVSQFVFRNTTVLIPDNASAGTHIAGIKLVLVLFDLGTIAALVWLLAVFKKHPAWLMAYAWNPLVLKEIANGGHLDSIAVFFMTSGIAVFL